MSVHANNAVCQTMKLLQIVSGMFSPELESADISSIEQFRKNNGPIVLVRIIVPFFPSDAVNMKYVSYDKKYVDY